RHPRSPVVPYTTLFRSEFTPHEHEKNGPCGPGHERCGRVWLFIFAIALHNLPEGMAIGVSMSQADLSVGLPLTTAIALQDIPERSEEHTSELQSRENLV